MPMAAALDKRKPLWTFEDVRERMGLDSSIPDDDVQCAHLYAQAMASIRVELMFADAGIPGGVQH